MPSEAERLESLWEGEFGSSYTERNSDGYFLRSKFFESIGTIYKPHTVLEVGCNAGNNLKFLGSASHAECYGLDINKSALRKARVNTPGLNLVYAKARENPFRDDFFDLTFTCGVLIHQPEESLRQVMGELVRTSKRYVLCMEYYRPVRTVIPYRNETAALFGDDYGKIYRDEFKLEVLEKGLLRKDQGFDRLTWWMLEKK